MRDIGKNIRDLRSKRNMTQDELAEKLFVTRQTVSNYETGRSRPDLDMLVKIAEVLECDTNAILFGTPIIQKREREKERFWRGFVLFLVMLYLILWIGPKAEAASRNFVQWLFCGWYAFLVIPAYAVVGWLVGQVFRGWLEVPMPSGRWVPFARWGLLAVLGALVFYIGLPVFERLFHARLIWGPMLWLRDLMGWFIYWPTNNPWMLVVSGILLNLLGFPKMRDKSGEDVVS